MNKNITEELTQLQETSNKAIKRYSDLQEEYGALKGNIALLKLISEHNKEDNNNNDNDNNDNNKRIQLLTDLSYKISEAKDNAAQQMSDCNKYYINLNNIKGIVNKLENESLSLEVCFFYYFCFIN